MMHFLKGAPIDQIAGSVSFGIPKDGTIHVEMRVVPDQRPYDGTVALFRT